METQTIRAGRVTLQSVDSEHVRISHAAQPGFAVLVPLVQLERWATRQLRELAFSAPAPADSHTDGA